MYNFNKPTFLTVKRNWGYLTDLFFFNRIELNLEVTLEVRVTFGNLATSIGSGLQRFKLGFIL